MLMSKSTQVTDVKSNFCGKKTFSVQCCEPSARYRNYEGES